jgi:hypothetical protein
VPVAALLKYLELPLRPTPLLFVAVFSLLLALALRAGFLGLPLLLILLSWTAKYAFVVMDHVAGGHDEPPPLTLDMVNPASEQRPLVLVALVGAGALATRALEPLAGPVAADVLRLAGLALLPAVAAAMAATGSAIRGLDPRLWLGLVREVPGAYGALVVVIVALWLGAPALLAASGLAAVVPQALLFAVALYLWLASFACIGGLLFEQRESLGLDVVSPAERRAARDAAERERERDRAMDRLFAEWRGGEHEGALDTVRRRLAAAADPLAEFRWLYARAARWEDPRLADHLARWAVPRLLAARRHGELLALVRERLAADPAFRPLEAGELVGLVRLARAAGDRALAARLLEGFEQHFPGSPAAGIVARLRQEKGGEA